MCRQMACGMGFRIRKLLLGSLFTKKTSVCMNLSPCISAGLSSIASFSTALRRTLGKGSADRSLRLRLSPCTLSWCLGSGSVVGVTVLFLGQQQQHREASSPPSARGCLFRALSGRCRRQPAPVTPPPRFASQTGAASHPGGDVHGVQAAGQGCLQVPQRVQALHFAVPAVDELLERVLLQQGAHVLEEEALAERGQFWCIVNLRETAALLTPSVRHRPT